MEALYEYKPEYYCDRCKADVRPNIVLKSQVMKNLKTVSELTVEYRAVECPICGKTLCEREFDYAFIKAVERARAT